ncbi:PadR family transcriptional regulator [Streptomyces palmae]|uniref:PadR family transcriptional regulator n=1 Tax=Streptomyces palmae TaxID=1701085 RepID=A0A4Z0HCK8_9ACTN|nr:PadR family transcriptional regulator [Streptomyces palmae]TGB08658.1 PadR family transcriptional regulator [Streptomyces palmae]
MALRHAVLAALLDEELSGYQLAKSFRLGVANFWHAQPQQLYVELTRLEKDGLISGREVVQESRPNKRVFTVTDAGRAELEYFTAAVAKPSVIRDDLLVKVYSADHVDSDILIVLLAERVESARDKIELIGELLRTLRGDRTEEEFLRRGERVGPYLTGLRGLAFEQGNLEWCERAIAVLTQRQADRDNHA